MKYPHSCIRFAKRVREGMRGWGAARLGNTGRAFPFFTLCSGIKRRANWGRTGWAAQVARLAAPPLPFSTSTLNKFCWEVWLGRHNL